MYIFKLVRTYLKVSPTEKFLCRIHFFLLPTLLSPPRFTRSRFTHSSFAPLSFYPALCRARGESLGIRELAAYEGMGQWGNGSNGAIGTKKGEADVVAMSTSCLFLFKQGGNFPSYLSLCAMGLVPDYFKDTRMSFSASSVRTLSSRSNQPSARYSSLSVLTLAAFFNSLLDIWPFSLRACQIFPALAPAISCNISFI